MAANGNAIYENTAFRSDEGPPPFTSTVDLPRGRPSDTKSVELKDNASNERKESNMEAAPPPLWDTFAVKARAEYHDDVPIWFNLSRCMKVFTICLCFVLILASGMMSKLTLTLIATNLYSRVQCDCGTSCSACTSTMYNITITPSPYSQKKTVLWSWSLILVVCFPYSLTLIRNVWKSISFSRPRWFGFRVLITALGTEALHSIGVVMLTTLVLPTLDMFHAILIFLGLGIIPSLLRMLNKESDSNCRLIHILVNLLALLGQITALFAYPLTMSLFNKSSSFNIELVAYLGSLLLMSVHWWPNYFDDATLTFQRLGDLVLRCNVDVPGRTKRYKYSRMIGSSSYILQIAVNTIKIVITILGVTTSVSNKLEIPFEEFYNLNAADLSCSSLTTCAARVSYPTNDDLAPIYIALVSISSALLCYYMTLHAVKAKFPAVCFALPLVLLTPFCLIFIILSKLFPAFLDNLNQPLILFNLMDSNIFGEKLQPILYWAALVGMFAVWFLSQLWSSFHAWRKPHKKIPRTERLYLLPMFDAECIEQSLLYNRKVERVRRKKERTDNDTEMRVRADSEYYEDINVKFHQGPPENDGLDMYRRDPHSTQIYFCATMWHETKKEMLLMFKSVLRMDFDHYIRRSAQELSKKVKSDFYNFETHIFFDDAFEPHNNQGEDFQVNTYVKQLIEVVPEAVGMFYNRELNIAVKDPVKIPTPYGGRLEWELPSHTKLIAHLKDKAKIRHKKRWSQVMYMYYFLGELLMSNPIFSDNEKIIAARNTYLLALDGDVDFKPEAVLLLVDMMKKNERVGAACGRIHPIGSGPIVWYQKFEYAIAHWLQKATEHVLGCVLCSPGCFSLFRAEALMQDNVMAKYATTSTRAIHYLQYDQGEDRWLCTLLLQAGYKVEYNAAADAFTFAPEGFDEFFNQRRRWGPSTMANILDLIMDAQNVIRINGDMSLLYVIYQAVQFFASIIGPGTIFLMITGALSTTTGLDLTFCLIVNLVPNVLFIIISFFVKSPLQLKMAKVMTIVYALVMCLVLISIIIDINGNPCSPTAVFFFTVAGVFIVAAFMHPQEFTCVLHGLTYYILIPCMYMLLIFYSFININNVSWGTRETAPTPSEQTAEKAAAEKAAAEKAKQDGKSKNFVDKLTSIWKGGSAAGDTDGHKLALGDVCQIVCCPRSTKDKRNEEYWQINQKLDKLTNLVYDKLLAGSNEGLSHMSVTDSDDEGDQLEADETYDNFEGQPVVTRQPAKILRRKSSRRKIGAQVTIKEPRNDLKNPYWVEDTATGGGDVQLISDDETDFWRAFIAKYLTPLDKSIVQQEKVERQLQNLRVNVNFAFFLTNAMFITIVFTLQQNSEQLSFYWPCGGDGEEKVEPLSLTFLVFFMVVLGIQFFGMIMHRLGTFWHIMASTPMTKPKEDPHSFWSKILKNEMKGDDDEGDDGFSDDDDTMSNTSGNGDDPEDRDRNQFARNTSNLLRRSRRNTTLKIIAKGAAPATAVNTSLDQVFKPKIEALANDSEEALEEHFGKLTGKERRATVKFIKRQKSSMPSLGISRSPSVSAGTSQQAPSTSGLRRPGNRHSSALET